MCSSFHDTLLPVNIYLLHFYHSTERYIVYAIFYHTQGVVVLHNAPLKPSVNAVCTTGLGSKPSSRNRALRDYGLYYSHIHCSCCWCGGRQRQFEWQTCALTSGTCFTDHRQQLEVTTKSRSSSRCGQTATRSRVPLDRRRMAVCADECCAKAHAFHNTFMRYLREFEQSSTLPTCEDVNYWYRVRLPL